jgi:hypothetical protein
MKILSKLPKGIAASVAAALVVSALSSFVTYKILERKIPKIAVVDLSYLNNDFMLKLSRYLVEHKMGDDALTVAVKTHLQTLESILKDISHSHQNYILMQKQTVVSEDVEDVTKEIEKALFSAVVSKTKEGEVSDERAE